MNTIKQLMMGSWTKNPETGKWDVLVRHTQWVELGDRIKVVAVKRSGEIDLVPAEVTGLPFRSKFKSAVHRKKDWLFFARVMDLEELLPENLSDAQFDSRYEKLEDKWHNELERLEERVIEGRAINITHATEKVLKKQRKKR